MTCWDDPPVSRICATVVITTINFYVNFYDEALGY